MFTGELALGPSLYPVPSLPRQLLAARAEGVGIFNSCFNHFTGRKIYHGNIHSPVKLCYVPGYVLKLLREYKHTGGVLRLQRKSSV